MDDATLRDLMVPVPTQLRAILQPTELLDKLGISSTAPEEDLRSGITLLVEEASGNYRIEASFLEHLYQVLALTVETDPRSIASVIAETPFPLGGFILHQPAAASAVLSSDIDLAVQLVRDSDPMLAPPARIINRLIKADPSLAATLVIALYDQGEREIVTESMAYFAYDKARSERFPSLPISLNHDGAFLGYLLQRTSAEWLEERLAESVQLYRQRVQDDKVGPRFLDEYRATLEAAAARATTRRGTLTDIIRNAFD